MKYKLSIILLLFVSVSMHAQDEGAIDIVLADIPPITANCNKNVNDEELKACFTKSITNQIVSKLNASLWDEQGLDSGNYKVNAFFTINKRGKVTKVRVPFKNKAIANEIVNAVKSIDKMSPAYLDGRPVKVNFSLPILFRIN